MCIRDSRIADRYVVALDIGGRNPNADYSVISVIDRAAMIDGILDLSFNPEITDELMVIYFDLNKEIFCITHES